MSQNRKIIIILGPTASGKTGIGVKLAKEFNGEIISADSRQVFRGLDLGTGKEGAPAKNAGISNSKFQISNQTPNLGIKKLKNCDLIGHSSFLIEELRNARRCIEGVPQWLIDICEPEEKFNLFDWLKLVNIAMEDIWSRGKLPIIVGGTGLYIQALTEGFRLEKIDHSVIPAQAGPEENIGVKIQAAQAKQFPGSPGTTLKNTAGPEDDTARSRDQLSNLTIEQLNNLLKDLDPEALKKVDQKNPRRLIRAIELAQEGVSQVKIKPDFGFLQIGIDLPREELHRRIDRRVDERFEQGMMEEVANLLEAGVDPDWLIGLGLEYREITQYLLEIEGQKSEGKPQTSNLKPQTFENMRQVLKFKIHQFARRQLTWFRRFPEIVWLSKYEDIEGETQAWLIK